MLTDGFAYGLLIIPVLAVLIIVHELGHFFAARACGVKVEEFGIGIPPRLFGWTRNGVIWSINAIPFGGFVRVKGEDGTNMESDSMNAKPPAQRAFFLIAGIAMNLIFAVVLMIIVLGIKGDVTSNVYVAAVMPGSPAAQAGWLSGDRIAEINGDTVESSTQVSTSTRNSAGQEMRVTIERRGQLVDTILIPRENPPEGQGRVGVSMAEQNLATVKALDVAAGSSADDAAIQAGDEFVSINGLPVTDLYMFQSELTRYSGADAAVVIRRGEDLFSTTMAVPLLSQGSDVFLDVGMPTIEALPVFENIPIREIIPRGFSESFERTKLMFEQIKLMVTDSEALKNVAGPIGMGQMTSEIIQESPLPTWYILAQFSIFLSINLAILNLLPLPALDGGRLFFVLIEVLRGGRKIAPEKEGLVHFAGLVCLLLLMFFIAFRDTDRLLGGGSFLP